MCIGVKPGLPLQGHCCDEIKLHGPDELHITTHLHVGDESTTYRVVYRRTAASHAPSAAASPPPALKAPHLAGDRDGTESSTYSTTSSRAEALQAADMRDSLSSSE